MVTEPVRALGDPEISALAPGDRVRICREVPATSDRPAHAQSWLLQVGELHRMPEPDGWVLVPAVQPPGHRGDFHIGHSGHGLHTWLSPA